MTARRRSWLRRGPAALLALLALAVGGAAVQLHRPTLPAELLPPVLPAAPAGAALRLRFGGVATLLFDDGETAWMSDGFFSRPSLGRVVFGRIAPDRAAIARGLERMHVQRLAAVVPLHSHYDHAMDAPVVAAATGALLVGAESTLNVGRGLGLADDRMRRVQAGDRLALGRWTLHFIASRHAPTLWSDGTQAETIDAPLVPPAHASAWREGSVWSLLVAHASGARILLLGSAGFVPGALTAERADVVVLGVGALGKRTRADRERLWQETVRAVGAKRVVLVHWDDFWQPADPGRPLAPMPLLVDDFAATLADLRDFAARDGVALALPALFSAFSLP